MVYLDVCDVFFYSQCTVVYPCTSVPNCRVHSDPATSAPRHSRPRADLVSLRYNAPAGLPRGESEPELNRAAVSCCRCHCCPCIVCGFVTVYLLLPWLQW